MHNKFKYIVKTFPRLFCWHFNHKKMVRCIAWNRFLRIYLISISGEVVRHNDSNVWSKILTVSIRGDKFMKVIRPHLTADQRGSETRFLLWKLPRRNQTFKLIKYDATDVLHKGQGVSSARVQQVTVHCGDSPSRTVSPVSRCGCLGFWMPQMDHEVKRARVVYFSKE